MDARLPDEVYNHVRELLPPQAKPGPRGVRQRIDSLKVLRVIWFVLTVGCRWRDVPKEFGCSGETARTRLKHWQEAGVWKRLHERLLEELNRLGFLDTKTVVVDSAQVRAFGGGDRSGPSPTDRRKKGTKYTLFVDARGTPWFMQAAAANMSDHRPFLSTVAGFPRITGRSGRPRKMPSSVFADAGYDSDPARVILKLMKLTQYVRRRKTPHGSRLGTVRWVVERSFSWLLGLRRMRIRYDRHPILIDVWINLSLAAVCSRVLIRSITQTLSQSQFSVSL